MTNWPADKVERRPIGDLIPYARNARTHTDEQVAEVAASMREWGWTNPVLVDEEGMIIAGHARVLAARQLRLPEVPVMVAVGWSEAKKRAYVLADNQLALNAGWDLDLLSTELRELQEWDFDMSLLGFANLDELMADRTEGLTDPDEVPETPANPLAALGDVWTLGRHRLVCGDATDAATVERCLNGVKPTLMVTDPPYGVNYDPDWRGQELPEVFSFRNAPLRSGAVDNDDRVDWRDAWALFPGDVAYVWHSGLHGPAVAESLQAVGFQMRTQIIWRKQHAALSRGNYHWQHEPCWYAVRKGAAGHWNGGRKQTSIWDIDSLNPVGRKGKKGSEPENSRTNHSTQKPVECMRRPIENNSSPGQAVYEPFNGSGTTIIAAEMTGRSVHAIDMNPAYVDVAILRWQAFTGQDAIHESGRSYGDLDSEREAKVEPVPA
jgi:DNA modification methylase